jgi:hypothetical protein
MRLTVAGHAVPLSLAVLVLGAGATIGSGGVWVLYGQFDAGGLKPSGLDGPTAGVDSDKKMGQDILLGAATHV